MVNSSDDSDSLTFPLAPLAGDIWGYELNISTTIDWMDCHGIWDRHLYMFSLLWIAIPLVPVRDQAVRQEESQENF